MELPCQSYQLHSALSEIVSLVIICNNTVRLSGESGKVDILLTKETAGEHWTELGKGLQGNNSFKLHKDRGMQEIQLLSCAL